MPRVVAGILLIALVVLAACGGDTPAEPTRPSYAVAVDAPTATTPLPPPPQPPTAIHTTALVAVDVLNVRAGPSADAELLGQVRQGDSLTVVDRNTDASWLRVELADGQAGWVSAEYVRLGAGDAQASTLVSATTPLLGDAVVFVNSAAIPANAVPVQLVDVIDGRAVKVSVGGTPEEVRYLGIDVPGPGQPGYLTATGANRALLSDSLYLVSDQSERDGTGRLLRYVYTDAGEMVNAELVRQGWAQPVEDPPDTAHAQEFRILAGEAAASGLGFWGGAGADGAAVYALTQGNSKLREGPGTDFAAAASVPDSTPLVVLGRTRAGDWLHVRTPERQSGWVSAGLVALAVGVDAVPVAADSGLLPASASPH